MYEKDFTYRGINFVVQYSEYQGDIHLHGLYLMSDATGTNLLDVVSQPTEDVAYAEAERDNVDRNADWRDRVEE